MNFNKCKISGQLVAQGDKGQYWIDCGAWVYLKISGVNELGPFVDKLANKTCVYNNIEEAKQAAEDYDKAEE